MRILFSMHAEPNPDAGVAGATLRLAEAMRRLGHVVDTLSFGDISGSELSKQLKFPWYVSRYLMCEGDYDVADLTSGDGWPFCALRRARRREQKPLIVCRSHGLEHTMHDVLVSEADTSGNRLSWKYPLYHGGYRLWECGTAFRSSDIALFLNDYDRSMSIARLGVTPERALKVSNGIADHFIETATSLIKGGVNEPACAVAFIGSAVRRKGIDYLCLAMIEALGREPNLLLGLFGVGAEAHIRGMFPSEFQDRISVTPFYRNGDLPQLLTGYSILAFPSLSEGFPLAPLEAMACGLVPVATSIPGPTEFIVDEINGLLIPPADATALAQRVLRLVNDVELRRSLRSQALRTALCYSWDSIATATERIYLDNLIRTKRSEPG
jgi:glycosyltransferase involved in cell wall biosynthesis